MLLPTHSNDVECSNKLTLRPKKQYEYNVNPFKIWTEANLEIKHGVTSALLNEVTNCLLYNYKADSNLLFTFQFPIIKCE